MDIKQRTIPEFPKAVQNLSFLARFLRNFLPFLVLHIRAGPQNDILYFLRTAFLLRIKTIAEYVSTIVIKINRFSINDILDDGRIRNSLLK